MANSVSDALSRVRKALEKKYAASTELFPDLTSIKQIEVIPAHSIIINAITGVGGFPRGRVTELYGPFSSGKTTLAIEAAVAAQRTDTSAVILFLDYEHAFDALYARSLGLDLSVDRFIYCMPEYFEQGADVCTLLMQEGLVDMVVVDSAAAMTPKSELEGIMDREGGTQKGAQAALMAQFLAKATKLASKGRKPALVLINQTRAVINIGGRPMPNAPKEQSAAGNAIKFYASIRLELQILQSLGDENRGTKGTDQIYTQNRIRVVCIKNKVAPPFMRGEIVIEYGKGTNNLLSIGELAEARLGIMSGAGFFNYKSPNAENSFSCRGREAFQQILSDRPLVAQEITEQVLAIIKADHAKKLGVTSLDNSGSAKVMEVDESQVLTLDGGTQGFSSGTGIEVEG